MWSERYESVQSAARVAAWWLRAVVVAADSSWLARLRLVGKVRTTALICRSKDPDRHGYV